MRATTLARNSDAQISEIMNDFEDTVIDKIVRVVHRDRGAAPTGTRRVRSTSSSAFGCTRCGADPR